jgi:predicted nucleic acid-binding protein
MQVLADTGPLVAVVSPDDQYHELCVKTLESLPAPLLTCWPVIAEAAWLLRDYPRGFERILESFHEGFLEILPVSGSEARAVAEIMRRYASLRSQFADAMLVYLANRENIETIFTLDGRDFLVNRSARKSPFRLVPDLR